MYRYPHVLIVAGAYIGLQPISTWRVAKGDITLESRNNAAGKARRSIKRDINIFVGYQSVNSVPTSRWFLPHTPTMAWYGFFFNSIDGSTASVTYKEGGVTVATLSMTSTSTVIAGASRVYDDLWRTFDRSANAQVKCVYVDTSLGRATSSARS